MMINNPLEDRVLAMLVTNAQMELSKITTAKCAVQMIADECLSAIGDIHPYASGSNESDSMQEACLQAVRALKGG